MQLRIGQELNRQPGDLGRGSDLPQFPDRRIGQGKPDGAAFAVVR